MKKQKPNFSHYPLTFLAAAFAGGIAISALTGLDLYSAAAVMAISGIFASFLPRNVAPYLLMAAFLALGAFCFQIENSSVSPDRIRALYDNGTLISGDPIEIEGVLNGMPEPANGGAFILVDVRSYTTGGLDRAATGKVKLFAQTTSADIVQEYQQLNLRHGTRLRVDVRLKRENEYQNPGVVQRTKILDQQGIDAVGTIKSPLMIERLGDETVFLPLAWIYEQRANLISGFKNTFSPPTAGVLIASLLGDKYYLDKETADTFREGGTFHILVISGLHITFIGALALFFIRLFTRRRLWQFIIADIFLCAYTLAVGADVPVVRATIMFAVLSFSYVIYRKGTLANALGLCALLLLAWKPSDLFTASFQLTFASVGAIVLVGFPLVQRLREIGKWTPSSPAPFPPNVPEWLRSLCEMLYWRERVWKIESSRHIWTAKLIKAPIIGTVDDTFTQKALSYLFEGILMSVIVQLWLLPLAIIYFHRVTPGSVLLNLWVGFFIAFESIAAVIAVAVRDLSTTLALPLVHLTEFANWMIVTLPKAAATSDLIGTRVPTYSGVGRALYFVYYIPVLALSFIAFRWDPFALLMAPKWIGVILKACFAGSALIGTILLFHPFSAPAVDRRLTVDFLDVGQGDSALVTFPNEQTLLIDGGGKPSFKNSGDDVETTFEPDAMTVGESVVSPFLWNKGYSRIDYILATHADADHIQGLTAVAKNFHVGQAYFGRTPADDPDFSELSNVLRRGAIPAVTVGRGDRFNVAGVDIEVLYPEFDDSTTAISDNNHSLVLRLTYGDRRFLFTGDIERETEELLASDDVRADVIKVPHHGSRTSSTEPFASAVRPAIAVVSVGNHSMFGHPNGEVIERWKHEGSLVYRTGTNGTITISTDGKDLQLSTFLAREN